MSRTAKLKKHTIYGLMHPYDLKFYYVGRTSKVIASRVELHLGEARSMKGHGTRARRVNRLLLDDGLEPIVIALDTINTNDIRYADALEGYWIVHTKYIGHPVENYRGLGNHETPRDRSGLIKYLHEALDSGLSYEEFCEAQLRRAAKLMSFPHVPRALKTP